MSKHPAQRDENEDAADVVRRSTAANDELPRDLEAAWSGWSARIAGLDERTRSLCRAAFEVGVASANAGRVKGAKAGGAARAAKLSGRRKKTIAQNAARTRWAKQRERD